MKPAPPFTEELEDFREVTRRYVEERLAPRAEAWEDAHHFPDELFREVAEQGWLGLKYPEALGGQGGGYLPAAVLAEELARVGSGGTAAGLGAHMEIATPPIWKFGTEEQQERWLRPAITGEAIAALAITEPDAGSDVAAIRTRAERVDSGYVVNGSKMFITNGVRASYYVTAVRTKPEGGHHGLSFLVIERGDGISASPIEKLGWHASDTGLVTFEDVFVPEDHLLGREHEGFYLVMANFAWERITMALGAVGGAQACHERTLRFVGERNAFGRPIARFQAVRHALADMATAIQAGRTITYDALRRFLEGENPIREVSMAKLHTQRMAVDVIDGCLQLHGGAGYMKEYGIERALRDARLGPIGGGTDEIMREIIGKTYGL